MANELTSLKAQAVFNRPQPEYRVCRRCIMDTSDPEIAFDGQGVCHHCHAYDRVVSDCVVRGAEGRTQLDAIVARIKKEGTRKRYDCIIGLSGGVDSSYVAYLVKQLGLRPLAIHLDNGWNSETAVRNIENLIKKLGIDLHTHVLDWEEFRRLQVAFLRASTPDSEIPTDHAIVAALYRTARHHGVRWLIEGANVVTESMIPRIWSHGHFDWRYIRHVNRAFGGADLSSYPHLTAFDFEVRFRMQNLQRIQILHYVDYKKQEALDILERELGWVPYGKKHYESIYTRFYQGHILPTKFGFDKRRAHLSCLVNNGELTREEALAELKEPAIPGEQLREDRAFVFKKLGLTEQEFEAIMALPRKTFWDYPSYETGLYRSIGWKAYRRIRSLLGGLKRTVRRLLTGTGPRAG
ncbi:MAG TPA: N-acetyl sugar amidotransferase [Nitrospiraceae bacterium]|nr:N-acetyl sugar amidotransferase [Nitrospiraceae bacterium]